MAHNHEHTHHMAGRSLRTAFLLTVIILVVEAVAGFAANSLALLSDAGHILTDAFALALAWYAAHLATRPPTERNTFGYQRSGILAALANASLLLLIAVFIGIEAFVRLRHPQHVEGVPVVIAAALALLTNAYIAFALRRGSEDNLNIRAALLHVIGDMAASAGVIVSGAVILLWHTYAADPLLSLAIVLLIAYGAWQIVRDTTSILMESTPRGVDLERLQVAMMEVPGVEDVHDLHVWALSDGLRLLSAHVSVPDQSLADASNLLADLKLLLRRRFHIEHATIELECVDCSVPQRRPIQLHQRGSERDAAR